MMNVTVYTIAGPIVRQFADEQDARDFAWYASTFGAVVRNRI